MAELSNEELKRYSRHLLLEKIGEKGQARLKASSVLIIGAGGLGSPAALYLAAAGVGTLGVVDADRVDISNLQRQILHETPWLGRQKTESAANRLGSLNPHVRVKRYEERVSRANALEILRDYDVILDATDNFASRYLACDAAYFLGKPLVYGAVFQFEGQASIFSSYGRPCYRCLYPVPPSADLSPKAARAGILGVVPGIIGLVQASEAIKLLLQIGVSLAGRLLLFDALEMQFREMHISRDQECALCGDKPTIKELIDYEKFCTAAHGKE